MWALVGIAAAACIALFAWWRSLHGAGTYYERQVYGLDAAAHRRYALISVLFAGGFAASYVTRRFPAVPLLAVFAVIAIFYLSSFARGFSDEE